VAVARDRITADAPLHFARPFVKNAEDSASSKHTDDFFGAYR